MMNQSTIIHRVLYSFHKLSIGSTHQCLWLSETPTLMLAKSGFRPSLKAHQFRELSYKFSIPAQNMRSNLFGKATPNARLESVKGHR